MESIVKNFLLTLLKMLYGVPNLADSAELRAWAFRVLESLRSMASATTTILDDTAVASIKAILSSDEAWELWYKDLQEWFGPVNVVTGSATYKSSDQLVQNMVAAASGPDVKMAINPDNLKVFLEYLMQILALFLR